MIKFFRKIRQRLLSENKFGKYIIYALGEIFLIVVGILIAVQIGSWKSNKDNEIVLKRSLMELNEELNQMIWSAEDIKSDCAHVSSIVDSIKNRQISARNLAENFNIITTTFNFPSLISNYEQVTQNLAKQSSSYEQRMFSKFLNSIKNTDLSLLKQRQNELNLLTNTTLNEWSKESWFEFRHIPDSLINYQDDFLNHYSYRNKLDIYSKSIKDFESAFLVVHRNLLSLKIFSDLIIMEANIENLPQILEENEFYTQVLTSCNNEEPKEIPVEDGLYWSHTVVCNLSNEDIEVNIKDIENENLVVNKMTLLKGTYFMNFCYFGNILEFRYPNGECKSVVITESMGSIILN